MLTIRAALTAVVAMSIGLAIVSTAGAVVVTTASAPSPGALVPITVIGSAMILVVTAGVTQAAGGRRS